MTGDSVRQPTTDEQLRLLVDSVLDYAIFLLDPTGHIVSWNRGAERLKQYRAEEVIGQHFSIFYPPESADRPARELAEAEELGRVEDEGWRLRKDGSRFWANVVITALRDGSGHLVGFAKVTRDLTERLRVEEKLRQSEERFRLMVQSVVDYAIFMLDPGGYISTWNEGAHRLKGYEPEEIIGRHFSIFYPPEDAGLPERLLARAAREGRVEAEGWRVRKDGTRFWADVVITALRGPDGGLRGFAKVTRDLTDRKRADDALHEALRRERDAANQLRHADRARQDLVAIVAHDLRSPVSVLHGTADMLLRDWPTLDEESRLQMLRMMLASSSRLRALVEDALEVVRLGGGSIRYEVAPMDVTSTVLRAAGDVDPRHERIVVHAPDAPVNVCGDEMRVWQATVNLLSNALKFSPPEATVDIDITAGADTATVAIADHGVGIAPEDQPKLFQRFSRLGNSEGRRPEGSGLGLYITRSLILAQGGELRVQSQPGEGSVFSFTLPLADAQGADVSVAVTGVA
jgi:PAS domain S-box-containing protein